MDGRRKYRHLPVRWMRAKKVGELIDKNLLACKTPLDSKFKPPTKKDFWTPDDLLNCESLQGKKIGLVIDLTLSTEYYDGEKEFSSKGILYEKFEMMGNGCNVPDESIRKCTKIIHDFFQSHLEEVCVIHCTHGYNRTGMVVCAYLNEYRGMSLNEAVALFKEKRPYGIYREEILSQLEVLCRETLNEENKQIHQSH